MVWVRELELLTVFVSLLSGISSGISSFELEYRLCFVVVYFNALTFCFIPCALKTIGIFKDCTFGRIEKITISSKKLPLAILFLWSSLFTQNSSLQEHMWARKSRTSVGTTKFFLRWRRLQEHVVFNYMTQHWQIFEHGEAVIALKMTCTLMSLWTVGLALSWQPNHSCTP